MRIFNDINNLAKAEEWNIDTFQSSFMEIDGIQTNLLWETSPINSDVEFSLVIPTFSRFNSVLNALQSALNQKGYKRIWEILIIDNTSFDDKCVNRLVMSLEHLNNITCHIPVKYYHNEINIGSGYNWNRGVQLARGKWVVFLHDDDILFSYAFRNVERMVEREGLYNKPLGYIQARRVVYSDTYSDKDIKATGRGLCIPLTRLGTMIVGYTETGAPSCGTTILREAYMKCGGINYSYGLVADAVLGYQIMKDYTVIMSDVALGAYKMGENESSKKSTIKLLIQADDLFQRARNMNSLIGKCWEMAFGDVQRKRDYCVKWKKMQEYKKQKNGRDYLYDVIRITYREMSILYAFYFEIKYRLNGLFKTRDKMGLFRGNGG